MRSELSCWLMASASTCVEVEVVEEIWSRIAFLMLG